MIGGGKEEARRGKKGLSQRKKGNSSHHPVHYHEI
jgi:hypothetical protein